jgi:hypothetical protein
MIEFARIGKANNARLAEFYRELPRRNITIVPGGMIIPLTLNDSRKESRKILEY